jgi:hypothetical protein
VGLFRETAIGVEEPFFGMVNAMPGLKWRTAALAGVPCAGAFHQQTIPDICDARSAMAGLFVAIIVPIREFERFVNSSAYSAGLLFGFAFFAEGLAGLPLAATGFASFSAVGAVVGGVVGGASATGAAVG